MLISAAAFNRELDDIMVDLPLLMVIGGIAVLLIGIVIAAMLFPIIKPVKVTDRDARLRGCGLAFLEHFPPDPMQ